ncbi:hypothetical protein SLS56_008825 [Neofusicoccum ribis]|uniref:Siderophore iron transporter n=1 Tax=Neofusicoccum ribis TaxID=45134 RepID=A0ABR3SJI0_9PEZI
MDVERDRPDDPPQQGVREIEAVRSVWTPRLLKIAYLSVFVVILGSSLETQASANLTNYVTSDFSEHALVSTISVSTSLVAGVARVPVAKLIDIWGRGEGYVTMVVFYWLGFDGAGYVLQVFLADTTSLRNRALAFSLSTTPYILTTFAGPAVAQWFQDNSSWRWAYIIFAIITPLVSLPIIYLLFYTKRIAIRKGILKLNELKRKEPWLVQAQKFAIQFDAGWLDLSILSKFIAGYSCLCLFVAWEWKFAPVKLIPYRVIMDRTVLGSCLLCFVSFAAFNCYNAYFPAYLQVVHALTIRTSGYIANIFSITSCILGIAFAYIIRQTGRYKRLALLALPLRALGTLALIPVVQPHHSTTAVVGCQLANAVAGAALVVANQTAVNAAVARRHGELATVLAVQLLFSSTGAAVGTAAAGAVWAAAMPGLLRAFLPPARRPLADALYGSLRRQLEWPVGSDVRRAVVRAYCVTQARLCVVAALALPFVVGFVMMWRDLPVVDEEEEEEEGERGRGRWKGDGPVEHHD